MPHPGKGPRAVWVMRDGERRYGGRLISSGIVTGETRAKPKKETEEFLAET